MEWTGEWWSQRWGEKAKDYVALLHIIDLLSDSIPSFRIISQSHHLSALVANSWCEGWTPLLQIETCSKWGSFFDLFPAEIQVNETKHKILFHFSLWWFPHLVLVNLKTKVEERQISQQTLPRNGYAAAVGRSAGFLHDADELWNCLLFGHKLLTQCSTLCWCGRLLNQHRSELFRYSTCGI